MSEVTQGELNGSIAVRKWIGDVSADRVGQVWRAEDHEALLRTMRAADELTLALVALARREALEAGLGTNERMDLDGIRSTTEPVEPMKKSGITLPSPARAGMPSRGCRRSIRSRSTGRMPSSSRPR